MQEDALRSRHEPEHLGLRLDRPLLWLSALNSVIDGASHKYEQWVDIFQAVVYYHRQLLSIYRWSS
jgi:hypothetical protein